MAVIFDYIRAAAMILGFSITWFRDRKYWFLAEHTYLSLYTGAFFVSLFFPFSPLFALKFPPEAQIDGRTACFARGVAAVVLGQLWFSYQCRRSRDETVIGVRLFSHALVGTFLLIVSVYGYLHYKNLFNDNFLWFEMLGYLLVVISSVVQTVKTRPVMGRRETKGTIATLLRLYFLLLFVGAISYMAFPSMMLGSLDKKPTDFNVCQIRWCGAVLMGWVALTRYALSFRHDEDRKAVFEGSLVTYALALISDVYAVLVHDAFSRREMMWMSVGFLPALIPLAGYYLLHQQEKETSTSTHYYTRSRSS